MFRINIFSKMEKILKPIGCEVRGIDLKTENRPESNFFFLYSLTAMNHKLYFLDSKLIYLFRYLYI